MISHDLKVHPEPFAALVEGRKTFEFRKNDRDFRVGDELNLREIAKGPSGWAYTERCLRVTVTYVLSGEFGVPEGFCVMSVVRL